MSVTVTAQVTGQSISSTFDYCYLYEPLLVNISQSDLTERNIYIDLYVYNTSDSVTLDLLSKYGQYDINPGVAIKVDLMRLAQQYHDSNVFKIGTLTDIANATDIPVSKYLYSFVIYSDLGGVPVEVSKLPIIGGRDFYDFVPAVSYLQHLTEAALYNVDLTGRWKNYPNISTVLVDTSSGSAFSPTTTITTEATAAFEPCGGMLIWKSRFGGWMYWGMDIATRKNSKKYGGNLTVGLFEATDSGNPYVAVDYTEIDTSYSITLKALSLNNDELEAVSGISSSPAVYYMRNSTAKLELMRLSSSSSPISTLIGGGDFSVSLKSISTSSQKAR